MMNSTIAEQLGLEALKDPAQLSTGVVFAAISVLFTLAWTVSKKKYGDMDNLRGPKSPSWLMGNLSELLLKVPFGRDEMNWLKEYGMAYKIKGCLGEDRLLLSDPLALKTIISNDDEVFVRGAPQDHLMLLLHNEDSIFVVKRNAHKKIRHTLNPGFSPAYIKTLIPEFHWQVQRIIDHWKNAIQDERDSKSVDLYPGIQDITLDSIGYGTIKQDFHALDGIGSSFASNYRNLLVVVVNPSKASVLMDSLLPYIPAWILKLGLYIPSTISNTVKAHHRIMNEVATDIVNDKVGQSGSEEDDARSVFDIFATGHRKNTLTCSNISSQVSGILIAGQDTTANTLSWCIYELAKNPAYQAKVREEVMEAMNKNGLQTQQDVDSLKYLNAFLKEILRCYPGVPFSERVATRDTVLPLSKPITLKDGREVDRIAVPKGQFIMIAYSSNHKEKSIWGEDAEEFRPERWLEDNTKKGAAIGPYANLLTFWGGARTCLGWRFAVSELQVFVSQLVHNFEFELSDDLIQSMIALTLIPVSKDNQPHLPLKIKVRE